jgi:segregation and condensation protein A
VSEVELNEPSAGGYSVSLPTFEGPLDLLLHLCQKHEIDILDIPIGFITEKYLEYLAVMQLMNLDVASEYLVMAATLAHIKSKVLLPLPPPGQEDEVAAEEEDPREALIRRLLEYQKYKQAAEELQARGVAGRDVFTRGAPIEEAVHTGLPPLAQVPLFALVEAFQNVLAKSKVKLSHDVVHERITLTDRINELVDILRVRRRVAFEDLFENQQTRFDLVITFLALLEMTRLRMTRLYQADFDSTIYVEFTAQVGSEDEDGAAAQQASPAAGDDAQATTAAVDAGAPDDASSATEPSAAHAEDAADTVPPEGDEAAFANEPPAADTGAEPANADETSLATDPPTALATNTTAPADETVDTFAREHADTLEPMHVEPSVTVSSPALHTIPCPPPDEGSDGRTEVAETADESGPGSSDGAPASHVATISREDDVDAASEDGTVTGEDRPGATGQASTDDASSRDNASSPDASAEGTASESPSFSSDPS